MQKALRSILLFALIVAPLAGELLAQPVGGPPPCWPPPCIPIDGGMSALLAAGLLFGGVRAARLRRRQSA